MASSKQPNAGAGTRKVSVGKSGAAAHVNKQKTTNSTNHPLREEGSRSDTGKTTNASVARGI